MNNDVLSQKSISVKDAYEAIAEEYDERMGETSPNDKRFSETEMAFVLNKITFLDEVLDIGCGTGKFTFSIAGKAERVSGLDVSGAMLSKARAKAEKRHARIIFYESDIAHMPFADHTYDVVTCMLTLMHILPENRLQIFQEINRVLKPGGKLIFSVKNVLFERLSKTDRFASCDIVNPDEQSLIFTNTRSGKHITAPWYGFSPQDVKILCAHVQMNITHLRGNIPISAWVADSLLRDPRIYAIVSKIEDIVGEVPPFNYLGYYLLIEAVKPML